MVNTTTDISRILLQSLYITETTGNKLIKLHDVVSGNFKQANNLNMRSTFAS